MTTINDISDLAQVLRDNPQWADVIRGILLGEELLKTPERVAALVSAARTTNRRLDLLEAGQKRLEAGQEELKSSMSRLEAGQETLTSRLGNIIGTDYERQIARSVPRRFRRYLNVHRPRAVYAKTVPDFTGIPDLLDDAVENGTISDEEADDLLAVDLILLGSSPQGDPAYITCEIAVTAYDHDVTRAKRRAQVLERAAGATALPAVIGQSAPQGTLDTAAQENVTFIQVPDMNSLDAQEESPSVEGP